MKKRTRKPIRVFYSPMSQRFYATQSWQVVKDHGKIVDGSLGAVRITGKKFDVTEDIASAVLQHQIRFTRKEKP